jgi:hypothetical protein
MYDTTIVAQTNVHRVELKTKRIHARSVHIVLLRERLQKPLLNKFCDGCSSEMGRKYCLSLTTPRILTFLTNIEVACGTLAFHRPDSHHTMS